MRIMKLFELFANLFAPKANKLKVKVKRHKDYPDAPLPIKGTPYAAGADLTCVDIEYDEALDVWTLHSGLCFEIPEGHVGLLFPRSSIYKTGEYLTNCIGVIDSDYRGEVTAKMRYDVVEEATKPYEIGDRFVQMIILPYPIVEYMFAEELSETERGIGGYGSTGK